MGTDEPSSTNLELHCCRRLLFDHTPTKTPSAERQCDIRGYNNSREEYTTSTPTTTPSKKHSHSRCRQRFCRKKKKEAQREITKQIEWEKQQLNIKQHNTLHTTSQKIRKKFGFTLTQPDTTHQNAQRILEETNPADYFSPVRKLAFHNLTSDQRLPAANISHKKLNEHSSHVKQHPIYPNYNKTYSSNLNEIKT